MINFLTFCINYKSLIIYSKIRKIFTQNILILFNSFTSRSKLFSTALFAGQLFTIGIGNSVISSVYLIMIKKSLAKLGHRQCQ